jgi:L-ascorbate metabolism protein UlaG (beta-lactamase superfamily)
MPSDHFDGVRFFNPVMPSRTDEGQKQRSVWVWLVTRSRGTWKNVSVTPSRPPERVHEGVLVTYINHATVLLQFSGLNIVTDPVWSYRASPFSFMGPIRYADPGVRFEDMPPIDIVLLSHNHYDHMDLATLRRIAATWNPRIYTGLGNGTYLARKGIPGAHEMDWWDVTDHAGIRVRAVPAQHFSARSVSDRNFTLWCGFVLETALGNIYFAGDTGYGPFISDIVKRYDSFICALIPIGAYEPTWMMRPMHTDPHEALLMHEALHIQTSIGIHHGTFRLTDEPQYEPKARIERERGVRDFRAVENGATVLIKGRVSKNS